MYQFDHEPERSYEYIIRNATQIRPMAGHGDDIRYLLQLPDLIEPWHRVQDLYMQEILVTLWTNFASTGYVMEHILQPVFVFPDNKGIIFHIIVKKHWI
ncbi:hypothetical protein E2C01_076193 [Portunus trituberculatus]|uniref:Carboxylesterase type B domain-containing protein n=1 Tax=Portunus trituberculatus TaxID=210409 RepID=A0A5B7ILD5_PORTR|nr:hypothetical protein [Portunus trituberculatus]